MTDIETLKARNDLSTQLEVDLGPPVKQRGHRVYWHCPFHSDRHPSLEVNEAQQRWYCPPCGLSGDVITWVEKYQGLDFAGACAHLAAGNGRASTRAKRHGSAGRVQRPVGDAAPPPGDWQEAAWKVVEDCKALLWSSGGRGARSYLHNRGLLDQTLRHWHIGFCPRDKTVHGLYVARGITIPWIVREAVWKVNVRRDGLDKPKYKAVKGSRQSLFGVGELSGKTDCIVVEGEFDAILLWQEVRETADVLSLGSAVGRLDDRWLSSLLPIKRFWIATDSDEAGEEAARYWLALTGARGKRIVPPAGAKDVTEAWQAGADLKAWLQEHLGRQASSVSVMSGAAVDLDARATWLLDRCGDMNSAVWASEYARLAEEAGWPCFGTTWQVWASEVKDRTGERDGISNSQMPHAETEVQRLACAAAAKRSESGDLVQNEGYPTEPCYPFRITEHRTFWKGPGGWTCVRCHPPPGPDFEVLELPAAEP